ncbi:MAG TPA: hypothetical protein VN667_21680 [Burkholderiales bacterium]|nr:hypothetical protein [Burkholderiales bacterium]
MPKVLTKVNIAYPDSFYESYESLANFDRTDFGEIKFTCFMDDDITMAEAKSFWTSKAGVQHIASWASVETPQFVICEMSKIFTGMEM